MNWLLKLILPLIANAGQSALEKGVRDFYDDNPALCKTVIASAYPLIDGAVEDYVKKTASEIDDDLVKRLKTVCEELAAEKGFELSNIDEGQPND